jgi:hypothetical protein
MSTLGSYLDASPGFFRKKNGAAVRLGRATVRRLLRTTTPQQIRLRSSGRDTDCGHRDLQVRRLRAAIVSEAHGRGVCVRTAHVDRDWRWTEVPRPVRDRFARDTYPCVVVWRVSEGTIR